MTAAVVGNSTITGIRSWPLTIPAANLDTIQEFNRHIGVSTMFAQMGILPDFSSAVAASAGE